MQRLLLVGAALIACPVVAQRARPTSGAPAAVAAALDSAQLGSMKYRLIGPYRGGRSTAIAGTAQSPNLFYSGSTGGGVWRTEDAGQSWQPITDKYFGGAIGSIDVADSDPNVIFVGTGSQDVRGNSSTGRGMWKSTDAGRTWSFVGLRETGAHRPHRGPSLRIPTSSMRRRAWPSVRQEQGARHLPLEGRRRHLADRCCS